MAEAAARQRAEMEAAAAKRDAALVRLRSMVQALVEDEHLSPDEEATLDQAADAEGFGVEEWKELLKPFGNRLWIARFNAGRLDSIPKPQIILKPNEVAHLEVAARLMKEVVHRETRGGFSGFSIPITKGVRFRTGSYRGSSGIVYKPLGKPLGLPLLAMARSHRGELHQPPRHVGLCEW